jgi:hypothetical protein
MVSVDFDGAGFARRWAAAVYPAKRLDLRGIFLLTDRKCVQQIGFTRKGGSGNSLLGDSYLSKIHRENAYMRGCSVCRGRTRIIWFPLR